MDDGNGRTDDAARAAQARMQRRTLTSAMVDGQATADEAQRWLQEWAHDESARRDWHLYHLIGDTLRSGELAQAPDRDESLLVHVRQALADEAQALEAAVERGAVVPLNVRTARPRRRLWTSSAAAVAGFALVAVAVLSNRVEGDFESAAIARGPTPVAGVTVAPGGSDELRRASVGLGASEPVTGAMRSNPPSAVAGFHEILRLPRGPASAPMQAVQVLYSNGTATISVHIEPYRAGEHVPRSEVGERLNALSVQRDGVWLTLTGDVPLATLGQFAAGLQRSP